MENDLASTLAELAAHANRIEKRLKQAEQLREEVVIAAINELRYAGRRFVDAWTIHSVANATPQQIQEASDHIVVARQYLQNADHDITDAICFFIHGEINRMQRCYGADEMIRVFPEYAAFAYKMQKANDIISGARETRAQRASDYSRLALEYVDPLIKTYDQLRFSETLALARTKRRKVIAGAAATVGVAGTLYGLWEPIQAGFRFIAALF